MSMGVKILGWKDMSATQYPAEHISQFLWTKISTRADSWVFWVFLSFPYDVGNGSI